MAPFGQVAEVQDKLAGNDIFCVHTAHSPEGVTAPSKLKKMGTPRTVKFTLDAQVPAHLLTLPMISRGGQKANAKHRIDGSRCYPARLNPERRKIAPTGTVLDALRGGKDMKINLDDKGESLFGGEK